MNEFEKCIAITEGYWVVIQKFPKGILISILIYLFFFLLVLFNYFRKQFANYLPEAVFVRLPAVLEQNVGNSWGPVSH